MAVTKYNVYNFVHKKAEQGALVAMVKNTVTDGTEVSTAPETGSIPTLIGTGIIRVKSPNNNQLIINSVTYTFDYEGRCSTEDYFDYKLMLAETQDKASVVGSVVETDGTTTITRGSDGSVHYDDEDGKSVVVSTLEARDQFAMQALKTLMGRMEKDPSTISDNEMSFLCEQAYQWAANMMTQASKVRAAVTTESSGGGGDTGGTTRGVDVDSSELTDTSDKLLNNIVAALEKTDESEGTGENIKYSERVSIPKLINWLTAYSKHTPTSEQDTQTTVGLDDLIKAIKAINVDMDTSALVTAINATHTHNIGNGGLGRDDTHPIYISGGGFPSRQVLPAAFVTEGTDTTKVIYDFLTFNATGAVGYSTKDEVKKLILGYLNSYSTLSALSTAVLVELTADAIYNKIQSKVDDRIKTWLQAARVTISGTEYSLTVNTPT